MAGRSRSGRPRCSGVLRDGTTQCNNTSKDSSGLCGSCQYREATGDTFAGEAVTVEFDREWDVGEGSEVTPDRFREQLAEDLAEDYDLARRALKDAMSDSARRGKAKCPSCKATIPVDIPDLKARVEAVKTWAELGYGRMPTSSNEGGKSGGHHPHAFTKAELDAMTTDQLSELLAADDPLEATAEAVAKAAVKNADGSVTVPADEWQAFVGARKEWAAIVAAR
jgi:hypothetical protein